MSLPRPNAAKRRTARNKVYQNGLESKTDPKHQNCLEEPKTLPKENQDKTSPRNGLETPKISPTTGLGKHRNDLEKPKASQKKGSPQSPKPAQKWFGRAPKPVQKWSGEPKASPEMVRESSKTSQRSSGKASKPAQKWSGEPKHQTGFAQVNAKNIRSKLRSKLVVKSPEWCGRASKPAPPNGSRAPRNGLGNLQDQPRNGLESQSTKQVSYKLTPTTFGQTQVKTFMPATNHRNSTAEPKREK